MARVTSGVGLFSGMDYATLVDQLIALDARPRDQLVVRMSQLDAQRTAFLDISARVSALLARVQNLAKASFFRSATAGSSQPDVLSATAAEGTAPGSYTFLVRALASAHQLVSRGFASSDAPLPAGTFTLESAQARVNRQTRLEELNGYAGVPRGSFKLTDGAGQSATIRLRDAQTLADVLDAVNAAGIGVRAELRGEGLVLLDTSGGGKGLRVQEVEGGHTAAALGFGAGHTFDPGTELAGTALMVLSESTPLAALNDGLGLRRGAAGTDFTIQSSNPAVTVSVKLSEIITDTTRLGRLNHGHGVELGTIRITTRDGTQTTIDLSAAQTVGDVVKAVEDSAANVTVVMTGGRLVLTDNTGATKSSFQIEDVNGHAARDLGILGTADSTKIDGRQVLQVSTLADVVAAINFGEGNVDEAGQPVVEASVDATGRRLVLEDHGGGSAFTLAVPEGGSPALTDLGFAAGQYEAGTPLSGQRILGGIDTVLLKTLDGGAGLAGGLIRIEAAGQSTDVDLQDAETLRDVLERINAAAVAGGLGVLAGYDATGTRLVLTGSDGTGPITVSDLAGTFAADAGLAGSATELRGVNLQRQYISERTKLADLGGGSGVALGKVRITDSSGAAAVLNLASEGAQTLGDVMAAINELEIGVEARINDTGDGLLLIDTAGGGGTLSVVDEGGTAARDLNLLAPAVAGRIDGSFELKVETGGGLTLTDLLKKVNGTRLAGATLLNDGSPAAPYRLSIKSRQTGAEGELIVDADQIGLDFETMTRAQDARIVLGDSVEGGIVVTSPTNTLAGVVEGLTLNLTAVSDSPITVTVGRDLAAMIATFKGIADDYNTLAARLDELGSYDAKTERKGILLGDGTLSALETRLFRLFTTSVAGATGSLQRLSQLGLQAGEQGRLTFDEQKFRAAYEADPEAVTRFFTAAETGLGLQLKSELERMTQTGGLLPRRADVLIGQKEMLGQRVDRLNELLARKRERLLRQFRAMEQTLGQLQSQQTTLGSMMSMWSGLATSAAAGGTG